MQFTRSDRKEIVTPEEIIAEAQKVDASVGSVLTACEAFYMNGTPDEMSGEVDSVTGHFYRVDRWIVRTDSQGFKELFTFDTDDDAMVEFQQMEQRYAAWEGDDA
jgi:hypothetical protein